MRKDELTKPAHGVDQRREEGADVPLVSRGDEDNGVATEALGKGELVPTGHLPGTALDRSPAVAVADPRREQLPSCGLQSTPDLETKLGKASEKLQISYSYG